MAGGNPLSQSLVPFFVRPHEKILREERIVGAWAVEHLLVSFLLAIVLWGGLFGLTNVFLPSYVPLASIVLGGAFGLHIVFSTIYVWRRVVTTEYVVTAEAVYARRGKLVLTVASALLDRVTDLHVHTSLVGRVFGYSGLSVRTAGGGVWIPGLRDPYEIRGTIQQARHELIAQLLREAGREGEKEAPAAPRSNARVASMSSKSDASRALWT
jgi:uncharacterized membrane protein YdbT with pleckstrin-like domain